MPRKTRDSREPEKISLWELYGVIKDLQQYLLKKQNDLQEMKNLIQNSCVNKEQNLVHESLLSQRQNSFQDNLLQQNLV